MPTLEIEFPSVKEALDQNEEYFLLKNHEPNKIRFHDYRTIYSIPGLYEQVFSHKLKCKSPQVIADLLASNVKKTGSDFRDLRILDFGAGNGLVAEAFSEHQPELIVGVDILEEAKLAAMRDRKELYASYLVEDLAEADVRTMDELQSLRLNAMVSVAAMGFGHIAPEGFVKAFNLIEEGGLVAFNLRDKFLTKDDDSGFQKTLSHLEREAITFIEEKSYAHRLSVSGEPIFYRAFVGKKRGDIERREA